MTGCNYLWGVSAQLDTLCMSVESEIVLPAFRKIYEFCSRHFVNQLLAYIEYSYEWTYFLLTGLWKRRSNHLLSIPRHPIFLTSTQVDISFGVTISWAHQVVQIVKDLGRHFHALTGPDPLSLLLLFAHIPKYSQN